MKRLLCLVAFLGAISGLAHADELSEAAKAVDAKSYDIALRMYTRLAQNGNAEAQFRLGQMIWYGEGTPADPARARTLFQQSAAAGNAGAKSALQLMQQRETRGSDIAYWTEQYDGADLKAAAACGTPLIPEVSKTNADIAATFKSMAEWRNCYNGFTQKMDAVMPLGSAIPKDVAAMMSEQEYNKALSRLNNIYADLIDLHGPQAQANIDKFDLWLRSTEKYAVDHNTEMKGRELVMRDQIEMMKQQYARIGRDYYPAPAANLRPNR